jgi:membrane protein
MSITEEAARGLRAVKPWHIPRRGMKEVGKRVLKEMGADHVSLIAAGCAFFGLLALFPAVAAAIAIWGLVAEPETIVRQIEGLTAALPADAAQIVHDQAASAASSDGGALLAAIVSILVAIYSASKGIKSLTEGLNIAYDETEQRGFLRQTLLNLTLTAAAVIGIVLAVVLLVAVPVILNAVPLPAGTEALAGLARWVVLVGGALLAFAALYRLGPNRKSAKWEWLSIGALVGVGVWVLGSALFSVYVSTLASYDETYGTLGGVVVLLMWLYLTAFAILLGAEVNAELERQTQRDTTTGPERPPGQRGAVVADDVVE